MSQAPNVPNVFIWRMFGASLGGEYLGHCHSIHPWPSLCPPKHPSTRATRGLICNGPRAWRAGEYSPLGAPYRAPSRPALPYFSLACTDAH